MRMKRKKYPYQIVLDHMGLINKGCGMFVARGIWCLADVSSVSTSSEQSAPELNTISHEIN